ncbi:hypothetical protein [Levilactobacillus lanxiensis]
MTSMHFEDLFIMAGQLNGAAKALEFGSTMTERIQSREVPHENDR